jgi:hypothetical protein
MDSLYRLLHYCRVLQSAGNELLMWVSFFPQRRARLLQRRMPVPPYSQRGAAGDGNASQEAPRRVPQTARGGAQDARTKSAHHTATNRCTIIVRCSFCCLFRYTVQYVLGGPRSVYEVWTDETGSLSLCATGSSWIFQVVHDQPNDAISHESSISDEQNLNSQVT